MQFAPPPGRALPPAPLAPQNPPAFAHVQAGGSNSNTNNNARQQPLMRDVNPELASVSPLSFRHTSLCSADLFTLDDQNTAGVRHQSIL